jgi:hypothetical protein
MVYPGMTYDALRKEVVLYGGFACSSDGGSNPPGRSVYGTWIFTGTNWSSV